MRFLFILIFFTLVTHLAHGQTFLDAYKKYRLEKINNSSANLKTKRRLKNNIKSQIIELDTIFQSYKTKKGFDFNNADTLFLIYESPVESPYLSHVIIWSGKDTISYKQSLENIKPYKFKRTVSYESFIPKVPNVNGYKVITEIDSLITLVSKRDFNTINHLGDNQNISDGSYVSIYVAYKNNGQYRFETCFPKQFIIPDTYRKE